MTDSLIREVAKIDRKAAIFMQRRIPLLVARGKVKSDLKSESHLIRLNRNNRLSNAFDFSTTPQGSMYWDKICDQLPEPYGW